ncbi:hypothetical protein C499_03468 [Halogeometricum borinquense DSM 11551]|uniref:Uncharacterized protein n=1 Tax=Halogeometricum borinquense (strain ATCC 700274 / DSM 11551 / JCM 10706 / KCTC 4070 / PR3) TaxID=469382 RepID=E4NR49_HALBP|nr:hypothetical protein [Halogeometricum borinquense]ADQ66785.1 hypothetical protein Hbor_11960 [Halogeometricum borinquense DSM 11551]ELY30293.1 hypothetical protein C499_03468 [Halogeometricum borinquense DSM 11551]
MSRSTDVLLFAILLVVFAIWMATAFDAAWLISSLVALAGLSIGIVIMSRPLDRDP